MKVGEIETADSGVVGTMRDGVLAQKFLLTGEDGSPNNYLLNVGRTGAGGWSTPRHRHTFDQIRFVLKGSYPIAKGKVMHDGWVGYFPESVHYGPQDRPDGLEMMVCQFGGASGCGFISVAQREAANDELKKIGEFKDGIFTYVDANGKKHNQDGSEACIEKATGKKVVYPKPRYEDIVLMDPANYEWIPSNVPGVSTKLMGVFTERSTRIELIKVESGASLHAGTSESIELLFMSEGAVSVEGKSYGPRTAFEFQANEGPKSLVASEACTFLRIVLPKF